MTIWWLLQWFWAFEPACVGVPGRTAAMGIQSVLDTGCEGVIHCLKFLLPRVKGVKHSWSLKGAGRLCFCDRDVRVDREHGARLESSFMGNKIND